MADASETGGVAATPNNGTTNASDPAYWVQNFAKMVANTAGQAAPGLNTNPSATATPLSQQAQSANVKGWNESPSLEPGAANPSSGAAAKPAAATPTTTTATPASPDDAITMGLGMFFNQYLAPMLAQQNSTNQGLISQYGSMMNQAMDQSLPPGIKSIMSTLLPQQMQLMTALNQSTENTTANTIPFTNLMNQLSQSTSAQQALTDAFTKAATYQELGAGSPVALSSLLTNILGGSNTLAGGLASLLGGATNTLPTTASGASANATAGSTSTASSSLDSATLAQLLQNPTLQAALNPTSTASGASTAAAAGS